MKTERNQEKHTQTRRPKCGKDVRGRVRMHMRVRIMSVCEYVCEFVCARAVYSVDAAKTRHPTGIRFASRVAMRFGRGFGCGVGVGLGFRAGAGVKVGDGVRVRIRVKGGVRLI